MGHLPYWTLYYMTPQEYLAATDWLVTRQVETGAPVPVDVLAMRRAARDIISPPVVDVPPDNPLEPLPEADVA